LKSAKESVLCRLKFQCVSSGVHTRYYKVV
jgi:hypothetical protein